jgi:hypothetical protein
VIEAIDTHYLAVKARILQLNPARNVVGVMDAMDWPQQTVDFEALYCIALGEVPIGKQGDSAATPIVIHTIQWTWMILGTNVQSGIQIRSRGDKYRTHYQIVKELEYGIFPRYAQKQSVSTDASGNLVVTPVVPTEYILWSPLSVAKKLDKASGLIYGIGTVRITNLSDTIQGSADV